ncbi:replication factor A1 [Babesia microti strain RI]|uniref:Replication factor A1 n=1 Tax=Babesia microti (strain RI) TaxID=1133968 RepID=A0A1N6LX27_BABMR|nr:replication factor A1 [Babesia microti strain RI]SIO73423.1 replication factor A1 [Babesia microti strain RI]|eukprot:XP_021337522.1 replication factor A1 [Babesia microti strain RI]
MVLPRNLTLGFFNTISERIKTDGEAFLGQTHHLDPPANLLCVSQSDLPQNRILLEVLDGSVPVQYKHVCVMLVHKTSAETFAFRGKVFSFDKYKLVATKIRYLIVVSNVSILDGDYSIIVDKVKEGLTFHPSLTIQQANEKSSVHTPIGKPESNIYQKPQNLPNDINQSHQQDQVNNQYIQRQNNETQNYLGDTFKNPSANVECDTGVCRQAKIPKNDTLGPIQRKNYGIYNNISELSLYTPKWTILARIMLKSDIRKFNTPRGESQLFSLDLCDSTSEIKATLFGDAVNKWFEFFEEGKVYSISKGQIRAANKKFNHLNHPCEIILDEHAIVQNVDDDNSIPSSVFSFTKLSNIDILDQGSLIDVIGVVCQHKNIQSLQKKSLGGVIEKRDIKIVDDSGSSIWVTLWHDKATSLTDSLLDTNPIIALKNAKITDWQMRKLDVQSSTKVVINPQHPQTDLLCKWWIENGKTTIFNSVSIGGLEEEVESIDYLTKQATQIGQDANSQSKTFNVRGVIEILKENIYSWPACPGCRKKMLQEQPESPIWRCTRCNMEGSPNHTYMLNFKIVDTTQTSIWASAMGNVGEEIMGGVKAEELLAIASSEFNGKNLSNYFEDARLTEHIFKVRVQMDSFLGEFRIKYRVVKVIPLEKVLDQEIADRLAKINALLSK